MQKLISRKVIVDGKNIGLAIVEISEEGNILNIRPFEHEEAETSYHDSPIYIERGKFIKSGK